MPTNSVMVSDSNIDGNSNSKSNSNSSGNLSSSNSNSSGNLSSRTTDQGTESTSPNPHLEASEAPVPQHDGNPKAYGTINDSATARSSVNSSAMSKGPNSSQILPSNDAAERFPLLNSQPTAIHLEEDIPSRSMWKDEIGTIARYSAPMALTMLLQYSLTASSIFVVGHLGKQELGAVSLASMTATITGYAVYQGLSTCLDTLCPQAYGSGNITLVGLYIQRVIVLLVLVTIPIGVVWCFAANIFTHIIPNEDFETGVLAGQYLKVILIGAPGFAFFEAGKRFVQAQGLFRAPLYVLLICAPLNTLMGWLFVWKFEWGFIGAPIAVAITDLLLPLFLALYVLFVAGRECWHPLTRMAFYHWKPMLRLAIPGLLMIEAEFFAWEILTLVASYLGTLELASQSALTSIQGIAFQISFSASIASGTRIGVLVGSGLLRRAQVATRVSLALALFIGGTNLTILASLRHVIPMLFTADEDVITMISVVLPICATMQIFDALTASCNGILRAIGRQDIGSYVQIGVYYALALPVSIALAFAAHWDLIGLWIGMTSGLFLIAAILLTYIYHVNWEYAARDATSRTESG